MFVWEPSPILMTIGTYDIKYYSVLFAANVLIGFYVFYIQMRAKGAEINVMDFYLLAFAVVVGGRIGYVLFYEPIYFLNHPLEIVKTYKGGLASHGSAAALFATLWWISKRERVNYLSVLDCYVIPMAIGIILGRIGNLMNSEIVGRVTDVAWGVKFPLSAEDGLLSILDVPYRHPVQLYEIMLGIVLLVIVITIQQRKYNKTAGFLISIFVMGYSVGRFVIEFFKENVMLNSEGGLLTMGQYLTIPVFVIGLYIFMLQKQGSSKC